VRPSQKEDDRISIKMQEHGDLILHIKRGVDRSFASLKKPEN
jgi:hypothetical protein